jgi:hypothetical protein
MRFASRQVIETRFQKQSQQKRPETRIQAYPLTRVHPGWENKNKTLSAVRNGSKMTQALDPETEKNALSLPPEQPTKSQPAALARYGLFAMTWFLIIMALGAGVVLLFDDFVPEKLAFLPHAPISAAPLLLIGAASLGFQAISRPNLLDLFKALIVSLAFIFWGIDQMLPAGRLATSLGDIVIVLYVIDLGWMMAATLRARVAQR